MADLFETSNSSDLKCDRYYTNDNKTQVIFYGGYEGIPENLVINVIIWALLLLGFAILRKIAWDYGRIALVSRSETSNLVSGGMKSQYNVWTSLFYGDRSDNIGSQDSLDTKVRHQDKGFCGWIPAFFRIKDEHILQKSGKDAVQYLQFQRYLIVYMSIITVLSIGVILPCNFQGTLEGDKQQFGHTTISNVNADSKILWVHSVFSVLYLFIAMAFMRHFSVSLSYHDPHDEQTSKTLMIFNIPKDRCSKNLMLEHFKRAYPDILVQDVQFAYNIKKLSKLDTRRAKAEERLCYSKLLLQQTGERPEMTPVLCGECCCCRCCKKIDCIDYYEERANRFRLAADLEKVWAFHHTLGIAFVTFESETVAFSVLSDFSMSCCGGHNPAESAISKELNVLNWEVKYAPAPDDIYWQNLAVRPWLWWARAICINILLFVFLFFLTTPSIIIALLNDLHYQEIISEVIENPLVVHFMPTLLLWILSALLPNVVYYVEYYFIGHWTRAAEHHQVMRKTYYLLLLMILVLPSLGLTSARALFEWLQKKNVDDYKFRWECIFIPDNGAFFVNYVITSAFIGTAVQLMRIPELLLYAIKIACAKSAAERTTVRKSLVFEYMYGSNYAWLLSVFAIIMVYSIPCPLITPFGLIYLILKYLVDRYNLFFAYEKSKIDQDIHTTAVNFVIVAVILMQAFLLFFVILRARSLEAMMIFLLIFNVLTLFVLLGRCGFGWFSGISPVTYQKVTSAVPALTSPTSFETMFMPSVLRDIQVTTNEDGDNKSPSPSGNVTATTRYGSISHTASEPTATGEASALGEIKSTTGPSELPPGGDSLAP